MRPLADLVRHVHHERTLLRLTQNELAAAAGVSQSFIAKLERGRLNPSYEAVRAVIEALERHRPNQEATARQTMRRDPVWVGPDEAVGAAMARMKQHGFSQLPVVRGGTPVGSISESHILRALERGEDVEAVKAHPVRLLMGDSFPTVGLDARRRLLVELLRDTEAVLVVEGGRLRGMVTKSDLW